MIGKILLVLLIIGAVAVSGCVSETGNGFPAPSEPGSLETDTCVQEVCNNQVDDDCDGAIDCQDPDCTGDPACAAPGGPGVDRTVPVISTLDSTCGNDRCESFFLL